MKGSGHNDVDQLDVTITNDNTNNQNTQRNSQEILIKKDGDEGYHQLGEDVV